MIGLRNIEIPPKIEILVFLKNKISMYKRCTKACSYCLDFHYKNFSLTFLLGLKMTFVCEFQHVPLWKLTFFSQGSIHLVSMRFCGYVSNLSWNKNWKSLNSNLFQKMDFRFLIHCCTPLVQRKKLLLQLWILQSCKW